MFWPLALWLPEGSRLRRVTLALTLGQLFGITALGQAHVINVSLMWVLPVIWAWQWGSIIRPEGGILNNGT
jgi:hypothetical protein